MRKLTVSVLLALAVLMSTGLSAYAIADPDAPPDIKAVYIYEDLLEDGDIGALVDYYLDYDLDTPPVGTPPPDEPVTEAYLVVFVDTDNVTQLKAVSPYTFTGNGYGRGLAWIYFTPAEVAAYGLDSSNQALYSVWLTGNPSLSWTGDPPKTIAGIDYWQTTGDATTLLALRVLYYADLLELIWALDLVEDMPLGNKLTTTGAAYFTNAIQNLRTMAPAAFSTGTYYPTQEDVDYTTAFGATMRDGTGTVVGSPITLAEGSTTVTVTGTGTFFLELERGTSGNVTSGTGTVTGSPLDIVSGNNTITATAIGTLIVVVALGDTKARLEGSLLGTGLDLTTLAAVVGMSRLMFSGLVWLIVSALICFAAYRTDDRVGYGGGFGGGGGKVVLLTFDICIISGTLLGLLHPIVAALLFIAFGAFTGYIIFFRSASL